MWLQEGNVGETLQAFVEGMTSWIRCAGNNGKT